MKKLKQEIKTNFETLKKKISNINYFAKLTSPINVLLQKSNLYINAIGNIGKICICVIELILLMGITKNYKKYFKLLFMRAILYLCTSKLVYNANPINFSLANKLFCALMS